MPWRLLPALRVVGCAGCGVRSWPEPACALHRTREGGRALRPFAEYCLLRDVRRVVNAAAPQALYTREGGVAWRSSAAQAAAFMTSADDEGVVVKVSLQDVCYSSVMIHG
jgi:hypothetical protein